MANTGEIKNIELEIGISNPGENLEKEMFSTETNEANMEAEILSGLELIFPISVLKAYAHLTRDAKICTTGIYNEDEASVAGIQGYRLGDDVHINISDDFLSENLSSAIKCRISSHGISSLITGPKRGRGRPRKNPRDDPKPQVISMATTRSTRRKTTNILIKTELKPSPEVKTEMRISKRKRKLSEVTTNPYKPGRKVSYAAKKISKVGTKISKQRKKFTDTTLEDTKITKSLDIECMECNEDEDQDTGEIDNHDKIIAIKSNEDEKGDIIMEISSPMAVKEDEDITSLFNSLQCKICRKELKDTDSLQEHVVTEHNITWETYSFTALIEKPVSEQKPERFKRKVGVKKRRIGRTLQSGSENEYKYPCYHCDKRFLHRRGINEHVRNVHSHEVQVNAIKPEEVGLPESETADRSAIFRDITERSTIIAMEMGLIKESADSTMCLICKRLFAGGRWAVRTRLPRHIQSQHVVSLDKYREVLDAETTEARQQIIQEISALEYTRRRQQKTEMLGDKSEFRCLSCDKGYAAYNNLMTHIKQMHLRQKNYLEILLAAEEQGSQAYRPAMKDREQMDMVCLYCGVTRNGRFMIKHMRNIHNDEENVNEVIKKYTEEHTSRINDRERERKKKGPQVIHSDRLFDCAFCGMQFEHRQARYRHSNFKCPNNANLKKKVWCRCSKGFLSTESLLKHKVKCDLRENVYMCHLCGKVYTNKSGLYIHKQTSHHDEVGGKYKRACEICNKTFYRRQHYDRHIPKHSNERSCQCELCGKKFKTPEDIRKHQHSMHFNRYTYHCPDCGHGMNKLSYLMNHKCGRVRRQQKNKVLGNNNAGKLKKEEIADSKSSIHNVLISESVAEDKMAVEHVTIDHSSLVNQTISHTLVPSVIDSHQMEMDIHHMVAPQEVVTSDLSRDMRGNTILDMTTYEGLQMLANATGYPMAPTAQPPVMVITSTPTVSTPASLAPMVTVPANLVSMVTTPAKLPAISSVTQSLSSHYYTLPSNIMEVPMPLPIPISQQYSLPPHSYHQ